MSETTRCITRRPGRRVPGDPGFRSRRQPAFAAEVAAGDLAVCSSTAARGAQGSRPSSTTCLGQRRSSARLGIRTDVPKRLKGFEPSTFCMASGTWDPKRPKKVLQNRPWLSA
jgi:hypothetical protein